MFPVGWPLLEEASNALFGVVQLEVLAHLSLGRCVGILLGQGQLLVVELLAQSDHCPTLGFNGAGNLIYFLIQIFDWHCSGDQSGCKGFLAADGQACH